MSIAKIASRTWGQRSEGLLAGALAGLLAVGAEVGARAAFGLPSLAELLGDQATSLIPGNLFELLLGTFGHSTKYLYFIGLLLAQVVGFALLGGVAFSLRAWWIARRVTSSAATRAQEKATRRAPAASLSRAQAKAARRAERVASTRAQANAAARIQAPVGWPLALVLASSAWLLTGLAVLPLLGAGLFGVKLAAGLPMVLVAMAVPSLIFGATLPFMQRGLRGLAPHIIGSPTLRRVFSPTRRIFLKRVTVGLVLLGVGSVAWRFITQGLGNNSAADANSLAGPPPPTRLNPPPIPSYTTWPQISGQTPELTATPDFYQVSKNIYGDPNPQSTGWSLSIGGDGASTPLSLSYHDLLALPTSEQITTLECISNPVGGSLMSSAHWKGVPLATLLNMAGIKSGVSKVIFRAVDDYSDSIHLAIALDPLTLLVHTMNDAPLRPEHGFPARMIVPGIYGMKHCKWITSIELSTHDFLGYWQQRGWNDDAIINLGARIDVPANGDSLHAGKVAAIAGVAFAGAKGVSAVEVSTDNGATWQRANLRQPLGAVTWTLWELPWTPPSASDYSLLARMIDLQGDVQQPVVADQFPNGATGYHRVSITVS